MSNKKNYKNLGLNSNNRIEIEQESDILIADYSFDECSFFKDDDDMMICVRKYPDA
jgi:hypothetical protein